MAYSESDCEWLAGERPNRVLVSPPLLGLCIGEFNALTAPIRTLYATDGSVSLPLPTLGPGLVWWRLFFGIDKGGFEEPRFLCKLCAKD